MGAGDQFRLASTVLAGGGNENTMAPFITTGLDSLLPQGVECWFDATRDGEGDRPDYTLRRNGAAICYIEAKRPASIADAFQVKGDRGYQVERYRNDNLPVILTDGLRWYDVSDPIKWNPETFEKQLASPFADFESPNFDDQSVLSLRTLIDAALEAKPRYTRASAPIAMQAVIGRINSAHNVHLDGVWEAVKQFLRSNSTPEELGDGQVGELIAFTLLAVAASLEPLGKASFISDAKREWNQDSRSWQSSELPFSLRSALNDFRRIDGETGDTLLGSLGWITIRSVASSIRKNGLIDWDLLSALWDNYLGLAGQRDTLGSWQTPDAVAKFQMEQTSEALRAIGYYGFSDPRVTTIDPCCGGGVPLCGGNLLHRARVSAS